MLEEFGFLPPYTSPYIPCRNYERRSSKLSRKIRGPTDRMFHKLKLDDEFNFDVPPPLRVRMVSHGRPNDLMCFLVLTDSMA